MDQQSYFRMGLNASSRIRKIDGVKNKLFYKGILLMVFIILIPVSRGVKIIDFSLDNIFIACAIVAATFSVIDVIFYNRLTSEHEHATIGEQSMCLRCRMIGSRQCFHVDAESEPKCPICKTSVYRCLHASAKNNVIPSIEQYGGNSGSFLRQPLFMAPYSHNDNSHKYFTQTRTAEEFDLRNQYSNYNRNMFNMLSNDRHNIGNTSSTYNYGYGRNTSGIMDDDEYYLPDNWYNYSRNTSNILHSAGYNLRSCWNNIKNYGKNIYNIISEEDAYTQLRIANEHFSKNCVTLAPNYEVLIDNDNDVGYRRIPFNPLKPYVDFSNGISLPAQDLDVCTDNDKEAEYRHTPFNPIKPYVDYSNGISLPAQADAFGIASNDSGANCYNEPDLSADAFSSNLSPVQPTKSTYRISSTPNRKTQPDPTSFTYQISSTMKKKQDVTPISTSELSTGMLLDTCLDLNIPMTTAISLMYDLKFWILHTLFSNFVQQVDEVNHTLNKYTAFGLSSVALVDEAKLENFAKLSLPTHCVQCVQRMKILLLFFEACPDTEYLINRIKEFVKDNCWKNFFWNNGLNSSNVRWNPTLPTDAILTMDIFLTFLDLRLICNSLFRTSYRPFTETHFTTSLDNIPKDNKYVIVYQESIYPPHYNLIVHQTMYKMPTGESNVFYTIVFLLYCMDTHEKDMMDKLFLTDVGIKLH